MDITQLLSTSPQAAGKHGLLKSAGQTPEGAFAQLVAKAAKGLEDSASSDPTDAVALPQLLQQIQPQLAALSQGEHGEIKPELREALSSLSEDPDSGADALATHITRLLEVTPNAQDPVTSSLELTETPSNLASLSGLRELARQIEAASMSKPEAQNGETPAPTKTIGSQAALTMAATSTPQPATIEKVTAELTPAAGSLPLNDEVRVSEQVTQTPQSKDLKASPEALISNETKVTASPTGNNAAPVDDKAPAVASNTAPAPAPAAPVTPATPVGMPQTAEVSASPATQQSTPLTGSAIIQHAQVATEEWRQELGQNMVRMVKQGDQSVSIKLNPAELGPLTVDMKVVEKQVQLNFASAHSQVRAAVEQAMPQLRDALGDQGMELTDSHVGEESLFQGQQNSSGNQQFAMKGDAADSTMDADIEKQAPSEVISSPGSIDVYV